MSTRQADIAVTLVYEGREYVLRTYTHEYRSLMALIYDKLYLADFGDCKGIGRCGTCHVLLPGDAEETLLVRSGNEPTTLGKMTGVLPTSRLSCHIPIDARLHGLRVEIMQVEEPGLY
jgi:ferredoxin, 2Fe-2S